MACIWILSAKQLNLTNNHSDQRTVYNNAIQLSILGIYCFSQPENTRRENFAQLSVDAIGVDGYQKNIPANTKRQSDGSNSFSLCRPKWFYYHDTGYIVPMLEIYFSPDP